ncbi:MAG: Ig-like domain-containing protein [Waterburya sp.]
MNNKLLNTLLGAILISGLGVSIYSEAALADTKGIRVTIENAKVQTSQLPKPDEYFVIDFESQNGKAAFSKTNNDTTYTYSNDLEVKAANQWGGANGSKFITQAVLSSIRSYKINVNKDQKYFGFWWSAGDAYNKITFKNNGKIVAVFKTADLVNFINEYDKINAADYYGNPAYSGTQTGHKNEPFSYVNVFFDQESYDEIVVATMTAGGSAFESDNHTFSAVKQTVRGYELSNVSPVANDDTAATTILNSVTIDVLANDTDPDNDDLSIESISNVTGGTAKILNNKIVYTAGSSIGTFSLDYVVKDAYGHTNQGSVTINVMAAPD